MKYTLHENGWTVIVDKDFDLKTATQEDADLIARLVATYTVVVFPQQQLPLDQELRIINMFKNPETFSAKNVKDYSHIERVVIPNTEGKIQRVTGEKDELGRPGLFGHVSDLDWHCNQAANEWRKPVVWLYGERGTRGSRTSWINHIKAYNDLSDDDKNYYKTIKTINGFKTAKHGGYSPESFGSEIDINYHYTPNLVYTNQAGQTGLFFPFLQIHQIVGMDEEQSKAFISKLRSHVEQEKYIYHHEWQDGDVVISDQWLGIHKRWAFDAIETRVLHRATFEYQDQDYTKI